jgi:hypothetical protein
MFTSVISNSMSVENVDVIIGVPEAGIATGTFVLSNCKQFDVVNEKTFDHGPLPQVFVALVRQKYRAIALSPDVSWY